MGKTVLDLKEEVAEATVHSDMWWKGVHALSKDVSMCGDQTISVGSIMGMDLGSTEFHGLKCPTSGKQTLTSKSYLPMMAFGAFRMKAAATDNAGRNVLCTDSTFTV